MEVPASEDLASHTVPESCGTCREARVEALTGVSIGQPLSTETSHLDADCFNVQEGNTTGGATASPQSVRRCPRPWHVDTLFATGTGRSRGRPGVRRLVRVGKVTSRIR